MRERIRGLAALLRRAVCRRVRVFRNTFEGAKPNHLGFASDNAANSRWFANLAGSLPETERDPAKFGP